jgi:ATP/maltotriose-dependent transcriptional regulator MalT
MAALLARLSAAQQDQRAPAHGIDAGYLVKVLRLIAAGRSNQRIAREPLVSLDTAKKPLTHVLGKPGAANRTEAAAQARQLGLIP